MPFYIYINESDEKHILKLCRGNFEKVPPAKKLIILKTILGTGYRHAVAPLD